MKDFQHLFKKGRSTGSKFLVVKVVRTKEKDPIRIGFVISNKTEKSAVKRNRAKRQLREIVHNVLPKLKGGFDVSINIKKPFLPLDFATKDKETLTLLKRSNLIKSVNSSIR